MIDRQILRVRAKTEFKKLKKTDSKMKKISFGKFFAFYKAREQMNAISGKIKEFSETVSDNEAALLSSMLSQVSSEEIIEVSEIKA